MTYNPERTRTGNKILRQRLKGPSVAAYYPRRLPTIKDLRKAYPDLETWDEDEEDRLESITVYEFYIKSKGVQADHVITERKQGEKAHQRKREPQKVIS